MPLNVKRVVSSPGFKELSFKKDKIVAFAILAVSILTITLAVASYKDPFWNADLSFLGGGENEVFQNVGTDLKQPKKSMDFFALAAAIISIVFVFAFAVFEAMEISNIYIRGAKLVIGFLILSGGVTKLVSTSRVVTFKTNVNDLIQTELIEYNAGLGYISAVFGILQGLSLATIVLLQTWALTCTRKRDED